jgi:hypothetical protein
MSLAVSSKFIAPHSALTLLETARMVDRVRPELLRLELVRGSMHRFPTWRLLGLWHAKYGKPVGKQQFTDWPVAL